MDLSTLSDGFPGISPAWGECLAQAASVCLEGRGHQSPKDCRVDGAYHGVHRLEWLKTSAQVRRTWADPDEAVEYGACGMAALLVADHTDLVVVERSRKGKGFDYWLGPRNEDPELFQKVARLEVSGIGSGSDSEIGARVKQKMTQTTVSDGTLPAYIVVFEFGAPQARMVTK